MWVCDLDPTGSTSIFRLIQSYSLGEDVSDFRFRWSGGMSCPGAREVERIHMLLYYRTRHYRYLVAQKQTRVLMVGLTRNQRT